MADIPVTVNTTRTPTSTTQVIAVPASPTFGWEQIAQGISSGSWAVLLAFGVITWMFKGSATKYLDSHLSLMNTMKDTLKDTHTNIVSVKDDHPKQQAKLDELDKVSRQIAQDSRKVANSLPVFKHLQTSILQELQELQQMLLPQEYHEQEEQPRKKLKPMYPVDDYRDDTEDEEN